MSTFATRHTSLAKLKIEKLILLSVISITKHKQISKYHKPKKTKMLLTPQHRRSSRVAARMQKEAQRVFNEKIANGTMSKEELLNTPKCLRNFDEEEDAILEKDDGEDGYNTYLYREDQEKKMLADSAHLARKALFKMEAHVISKRIGAREEETEYDLSDKRKKQLYREAQKIKRQLMKINYQKMVYALELLEQEISSKLERLRIIRKEKESGESIAARVARRRRLARR